MVDVIIVPTYNEAPNLANLVSQIRIVLPTIDILIVDDNSPDGTGDLVRKLAKNDKHLTLLMRKSKEGLGMAYIAGFKKVLVDQSVARIIMMDADLSHNPAYLPSMLKEAITYDVVLGSRYTSGGGTVGWEFWRRALSYFGNLYARLVADLPVYDCTGGFNIIRVSRLRSIDLDSMDVSGYAFIMELKFLLAQNGATFKEVPIVFKNRIGGESKMSSKAIARYFNEGILAPWKMRWKRAKPV